MWPWEHFAVAYVCYSLFARPILRRPPSDAEAIAVAVGSQLPDLIDKPLAWQFGVFESGYALGHSVFVAVPVSLTLLLAASALGRPAIGVAFAVGWLSHLPADVYYPLAFGGEPASEIVLWPLVEVAGARPGLLSNVRRFWDGYLEFLLSADGALYLGLEAALIGGTIALWLIDGAPGLPRVGGRNPGLADESDR